MFSEAEVIKDYMRRFEKLGFADFVSRSDTGRMEAREHAFRWHSERVKNSQGLFLGDAHYAFPQHRLGEIEYPHSEAEDGIQPVMPKAAWNLYRAIIYIDTPPTVVHDRIRQRAAVTGEKSWADRLSVHDLQLWREYEKRKLGRECERRELPFVVIPGEQTLVEIADQTCATLQRIELQSQ